MFETTLISSSKINPKDYAQSDKEIQDKQCEIWNLSINRTFYFSGRQAFAMSENMASSGLRKMLS